MECRIILYIISIITNYYGIIKFLLFHNGYSISHLKKIWILLDHNSILPAYLVGMYKKEGDNKIDK